MIYLHHNPLLSFFSFVQDQDKTIRVSGGPRRHKSNERNNDNGEWREGCLVSRYRNHIKKLRPLWSLLILKVNSNFIPKKYKNTSRRHYLYNIKLYQNNLDSVEPKLPFFLITLLSRC